MWAPNRVYSIPLLMALNKVCLVDMALKFTSAPCCFCNMLLSLVSAQHAMWLISNFTGAIRLVHSTVMYHKVSCTNALTVNPTLPLMSVTHVNLSEIFPVPHTSIVRPLLYYPQQCSIHSVDSVSGARNGLPASHCTALHCTALHCTALWSQAAPRVGVHPPAVHTVSPLSRLLAGHCSLATP